jgi:MFS family permease
MWFFAAICNVPVGWVSSKYGREWPIIIVGSILMLFAHYIYIFTPDCKACWESIVPLVILGFCYSVYSVLLFTSLATFVDHSMLGTAYGISAVFHNLGRVIFAPIVGYIQENTTRQHGYFWTEVSFVLVSALSLVINLYVYFDLKKEK